MWNIQQSCDSFAKHVIKLKIAVLCCLILPVYCFAHHIYALRDTNRKLSSDSTIGLFNRQNFPSDQVQISHCICLCSNSILDRPHYIQKQLSPEFAERSRHRALLDGFRRWSIRNLSLFTTLYLLGTY